MAAAELLAITKKGISCVIIKSFGPMWGQYVLDSTQWSAVFECDKQSNQLRANLISILINVRIVSDAPIRLAQFMSTNQIRFGRLVQLLIQTML